jgi:hypothetical protein
VIANLPAEAIDTTLLVAWRVWHARNEVTHSKPLPSPASSRSFLLSYSRLLNDVRTHSTEAILKGKLPIVTALPTSTVDRQAIPAKPWLKPNVGSVKLTIDGSFKDGVGGAGMILRDDTGVIIFSACKWVSPCIDPLEAELQACLDGLDLALAHSSLPVIIDTDSAQMVSMIQAPGMDRSIHSHIVSEIKVLVSASRPCSFVKVGR